jgi:hypothetical protein
MVRFIAVAISTVIAVLAPSGVLAAPGDALVGEWQGARQRIAIVSVNGAVTVDGSPVTCSSESLCVFETSGHQADTQYLVKNGTLFVQTLERGQWEFDKKKSHQSLKRVSPGIKPGRYLMDVTVAVKEKKLSGENWDPSGGLPDPEVTLGIATSAGVTSIKCKKSDTLSNRCLTDKILTVDASTIVQFSVVDSDAVSDDSIGSSETIWLAHSSLRADKPIPVTVKGALASITFRLRSIKE